MDNADAMEYKVPCSFESCPRTFHTQADMLAHKHRDPDHSHCLKCREEFATRQEFFLHKIGSPRHFTCPICMADFRSDSGRQRHFKESHKTEQKITCVGCGESYKSASTLIQHIELNECPKIGVLRMLLEQNRREYIEESFKSVNQAGFVPPEVGRLLLDEIEGASLDDSVAVYTPAISTPANELDCDDPIVSQTTQASHHQISALGFTSQSVRGSVDVAEAFTFSPNPSAGNTSNIPLDPTDLIAFEDLSDEEDTQGSSGVSKDVEALESHFGVSLVPMTELLRQQVPDWNAMNYFDPEKNKFVCGCGHMEDNEVHFEYHVAMKLRWKNTTRCDFCNRQFGSTFALVAHMETTHRDCNINTHEGCAKFLNNVTGGLVRVEGHLDDGSRRIVACQMQEVEIKLTPVAGHDLNNNPRGLNDAN